MKNLKILAGIILTISLLWSCGSSQQVACPDHSKNKKLQHSQYQAYKTKPYKTPRISKPPKLDFTKSNSKQNLSYKYLPESRSQITHNAIVKGIPIPQLDLGNAYPNINDMRNIFLAESDFMPVYEVASLRIQDLESETEKLNAVAVNNTKGINSSLFIEKVSETMEISDVDFNYDVLTPTDNVTKKEIRKCNREFYRTLIELIKNQPEGDVKPVAGFAVAALVLGIVSLFLFPFIAGPLGIIFGGIAMSRASKNPNKEGRGLAIAGLITGIVGLLGGLVILLLMAA